MASIGDVGTRSNLSGKVTNQALKHVLELDCLFLLALQLS